MIDLDELEALHREGLRYPEGVEYDVARTEAFDSLPALLRLARRARRLEEAVRAYLLAHDAICESADAAVALDYDDAQVALRDALAEWEE